MCTNLSKFKIGRLYPLRKGSKSTPSHPYTHRPPPQTAHIPWQSFAHRFGHYSRAGSPSLVEIHSIDKYLIPLGFDLTTYWSWVHNLNDKK